MFKLMSSIAIFTMGSSLLVGMPMNSLGGNRTNINHKVFPSNNQNQLKDQTPSQFLKAPNPKFCGYSKIRSLTLEPHVYQFQVSFSNFTWYDFYKYITKSPTRDVWSYFMDQYHFTDFKLFINTKTSGDVKQENFNFGFTPAFESALYSDLTNNKHFYAYGVQFNINYSFDPVYGAFIAKYTALKPQPALFVAGYDSFSDKRFKDDRVFWYFHLSGNDIFQFCEIRRWSGMDDDTNFMWYVNQYFITRFPQYNYDIFDGPNASYIYRHYIVSELAERISDFINADKFGNTGFKFEISYDLSSDDNCSWEQAPATYNETFGQTFFEWGYKSPTDISLIFNLNSDDITQLWLNLYTSWGQQLWPLIIDDFFQNKFNVYKSFFSDTSAIAPDKLLSSIVEKALADKPNLIDDFNYYTLYYATGVSVVLTYDLLNQKADLLSIASPGSI